MHSLVILKVCAERYGCRFKRGCVDNHRVAALTSHPLASPIPPVSPRLRATFRKPPRIGEPPRIGPVLPRHLTTPSLVFDVITRGC